jgi:DNA-binding MarR family transcriptional regulator
MFSGGSSPGALASRLTLVAEGWVADRPAERLERARRSLLSAVADHEPATLNQVANAVARGAPAVSRSVDVLVREDLIERTADPDNRRRLAMRLTDAGRQLLAQTPSSVGPLESRLERLAPSELRAIERAVEILERAL